tara:strand:+ start:1128 stop:2048 length:921 start_codon:yes stop_codon:yes gene_type:complete
LKKILIIKHGSLGDIVFSLPVIYSIKKHFYNQEVELLTEKKYFPFFKDSNYFNNLIEDNRDKNLFININLLFKLRKNNYDLIIDLQNSFRTSSYNFFFRLFGKSKISSSRHFAHHKYIIPEQGKESTTQGLFNQIKLINILSVNNIEYNWLEKKLDIKYDNKIVLFIPGVSLKGKYKQWQPDKFGNIAKYCETKNYKVCVVGNNSDRDSIAPILRECRNVIENIDNSPPNVIYSIAKKASLVITNDTGPGHIASLSGTKILWILNDNKITAANISDKANNFKLLSDNVKNIPESQVIEFINKQKLL